MSLRRRIARVWPLAAALTCCAALLAAFTVAMLRRADGHLVYPLDDTYIQMAIAKNLAVHGVWGVTRYEFSGAGSSLFWPILLASVDRLTGVHEWSPLLLNALAAFAVLALAYVILQRHIASATAQLLALGLIVVAAPLNTLVVVGMEHTVECAAALALAGIAVRFCAATTRADEPRHIWLIPAAAGVLVATRYDAASVVVTLLAIMIAMRRRRLVGSIIACSIAPGLAYAAVAWRHGWPLLPSAILIKQRLAAVNLRSLHGLISIAGGGLTTLVNTPGLFALVLLAGLLTVLSRRDDAETRERESILLLLLFVGAALIHVQFGRVGWLYRYESYLVVLGVVANASALGHRLPAFWRRLDWRRQLAAIVLAALAVHPLLVRGFLASRDALIGAETIYIQEYQWGRFFHRYPPEGGLLVTSLGVLSYFTDQPVVDPDGLATLELYASARAHVFDLGLTYRVAEQKGVRVSMLGNPDTPAVSGWRCIVRWTDVPDRIPSESMWIFAADADAAAHVTRDLKAFAAADRGGRFVLTFPPAGSAECPAVR